MTVAIYARKSTEQGGAEENKSVTRQVEHARHFAAKRGWAVDDRFVFVDDAISGAEFERRPAFQRLLGSLKPRPPFQTLVMSEQSRLGRESIKTSRAYQQIIRSGVRVF